MVHSSSKHNKEIAISYLTKKSPHLKKERKEKARIGSPEGRDPTGGGQGDGGDSKAFPRHSFREVEGKEKISTKKTEEIGTFLAGIAIACNGGGGGDKTINLAG